MHLTFLVVRTGIRALFVSSTNGDAFTPTPPYHGKVESMKAILKSSLKCPQLKLKKDLNDLISSYHQYSLIDVACATTIPRTLRCLFRIPFGLDFES